MPIYAYRCERCGVEKDVLQKFSDAPLTVCPECGAEAFHKRLTAPAFQLKGSGWYATDFRDGGRKPKPDTGAGDAAAEGKSAAAGEGGGGKGGEPDKAAAGKAGPAAGAAAPAPASAPSAAGAADRKPA